MANPDTVWFDADKVKILPHPHWVKFPPEIADLVGDLDGRVVRSFIKSCPRCQHDCQHLLTQNGVGVATCHRHENPHGWYLVKEES